jgi:hypothetical protein
MVTATGVAGGGGGIGGAAVPVPGLGGGGGGDCREVWQADTAKPIVRSNAITFVFMMFTSFQIGFYNRAWNLLIYCDWREREGGRT